MDNQWAVGKARRRQNRAEPQWPSRQKHGRRQRPNRAVQTSRAVVGSRYDTSRRALLTIHLIIADFGEEA
jgi:hypothetical protein